MKKYLSLLLAFILVLSLFSFVSCSKKNDTDGDVNKEPDETVAETNGLPYSVFDEPKDSTDTTEPMVKISAVDKKYLVNSKGSTFDPLRCPYFDVSGFSYLEENGNYYRMKRADSSKYPADVRDLADNTAGGRIRFRTDSSYMKISVKLSHSSTFTHMTIRGASGIDVYKGTGSNKTFVKTVSPDKTSTVVSETVNLEGVETEYTLVLPLYTGISSLTITLDPKASIGEPTEYAVEKPVVFYGSSITQGCSASRPGTNYADVVTRMLDANLVNLGFSGAAKGEQVVADYIAGIEMSAFVLDYDYNADSPDHLKSTHYNFYKTVRTAHPDVPIIIMTKNNVAISDDDTNAQRRAVIKETYTKAVSEGDKNVYFIDGQYVYPEIARDLCTVDGTHPSDLGMYYMAQALYPVLKEALSK